MPTKAFHNRIKEISENSTDGAVTITLQILEILQSEIINNSKIESEINSVLIEFDKVHPEMISISNTINNIRTQLKEDLNKQSLLEIIQKEICLVKEREEKTVKNLAKEIHKYKRIMIISSSKTVNEALIKYSQKDNFEKIFVLESRPLLEGRVTAKKLAQAGFRIHLIVDAAAGIFAEKVDAIILGADTIFQDGSIINKVGSLPLALIAQYYNIPVIIGASTNKLSTKKSSEFWNLIEKKPKDEIWENLELGIEIENIYFDFIPSNLITKIISEI